MAIFGHYLAICGHSNERRARATLVRDDRNLVTDDKVLVSDDQVLVRNDKAYRDAAPCSTRSATRSKTASEGVRSSRGLREQAQPLRGRKDIRAPSGALWARVGGVRMARCAGCRESL